MKEALLQALEASFDQRIFEPGKTAEIVAVFRASHPAVGDLVIWDDGDNEVRISIENITHGHFGAYDASSAEEASARVIASVVEFLEALFGDRVVLWRALGGMAGGWQVYDSPDDIPKRALVKERFLWSGPLTRGKAPSHSA